jgi:hypothetical protein
MESVEEGKDVRVKGGQLRMWKKGKNGMADKRVTEGMNMIKAHISFLMSPLISFFSDS